MSKYFESDKLSIGSKVEAPKKPRDMFVMEVSCMHGDGDLYTENVTWLDNTPDSVKFLEEFLETIKEYGAGDIRSKRKLCKLVDKYGIDDLPIDVDATGGDGDYMASVKGISITYFDPEGTEFHVCVSPGFCPLIRA